ncbi:MAG: GNAT family N-acetyltransferase [Bacteroidota bacterium]
MTNAIIRAAQPADLPQLIDLCAAHAAYEQCPYNRAGKAQQLGALLFQDSPSIYCLVVENDHRLVGFATYMKQYATWDAAPYIYMDCLFLVEAARGFGYGEKLVRAIQQAATQLGCSLIQWQTPDFNTRAIKFYYRVGATAKSKERFFLAASFSGRPN